MCIYIYIYHFGLKLWRRMFYLQVSGYVGVQVYICIYMHVYTNLYAYKTHICTKAHECIIQMMLYVTFAHYKVYTPSYTSLAITYIYRHINIYMHTYIHTCLDVCTYKKLLYNGIHNRNKLPGVFLACCHMCTYLLCIYISCTCMLNI